MEKVAQGIPHPKLLLLRQPLKLLTSLAAQAGGHLSGHLDWVGVQHLEVGQTPALRRGWGVDGGGRGLRLSQTLPVLRSGQGGATNDGHLAKWKGRGCRLQLSHCIASLFRLRLRLFASLLLRLLAAARLRLSQRWRRRRCGGLLGAKTRDLGRVWIGAEGVLIKVVVGEELIEGGRRCWLRTLIV